MLKGLKIFSITLLVQLLIAPFAFANSYLDMITKEPENLVHERANENSIYTPKTTPNLWYDSRIETKSPVVTSPYPKYLAWQKAKANEHNYYNYKETVQNAIYTLEAIAFGALVYEMFDD